MAQRFSCHLLHLKHKVLVFLVCLVFSLLIREAFRDNTEGLKVDEYPFRDITKSVAERVNDLISRLHVTEKVEQLGSSAPDIARLGIPSYSWWSEALHGVAICEGVNFDGRINAATSFPQTILTAASFNDTLFKNIGQVVSTEARAMFNTGQSHLTFWSPNINIFRDPRWGRGHETPGEDPRLSSNYAVEFVRGMQQVDEGEGLTGSLTLKTSACCKHFTAYDLEKWGDTDRDHFDASVTDQDLEDTFNPPFKSCIQEGSVSSVMCAYTRINGIPACGSRVLLTDTVKRDWGFDGYVVSDCDAVYDMTNEPAFSSNLEDAVADSLEAGVDLNCGITYTDHARLALEQGKVNESQIDAALFNLFSVRMRLGLFDGDPQRQLYGNLDEKNVCTAEHQALALEAALQGIVLLKNDNNVLPLSLDNIRSLAVLGPNAHEDEYRMLGSYYGVPCTYIAPLHGLAERVPEVTYHAGCTKPSCSEHDFSDAEQAARGADAVVMVMGLSILQEGEGLDRTSLRLPGHQQRLICSVAKAARGPLVLVIMSGGPVDISFIEEESLLVHGVLWVGYPGQVGGLAIADIIFGARNPEGKLPMTWYPESFTKVPMTNMNMRPNSAVGYPGRTYRFYTERPIFEFGHGLSYTTFHHDFVSAPSVVRVAPSCQSHLRLQSLGPIDNRRAAPSGLSECSGFQVTGVVRNTGDRGGTSVVLLFFSPPGRGQNGAIIRSLVGYQRVYVEAKRKSTVSYRIDLWKDLSTVKANGERYIEHGEYTLFFGNNPSTHGSHKLQIVETREESIIKSR